MTSSIETVTCDCTSEAQTGFVALSQHNTLEFNVEACINCGMCSAVCPQGVFAPGARGTRRVQIVRADTCMECGACQLNCPTGAARVNSGVGCATALLNQALGRTSEACCGPTDDGQSGCC